MLEELPSLVLVQIVHFLTLIDVLSFRLTSQTTFEICDDVYFKKLNNFNTIVLFRRLFVDIDDLFRSIDCNVSKVQSSLFGSFEIKSCKVSTLCFLQFDNKILNLGHNFSLATFMATSKRDFTYFEIQDSIFNHSMLFNRTSYSWFCVIMHQQEINIRLNYLFHPVEFLSLFSDLKPPKTILSRLGSTIIFFEKSPQHYYVSQKTQTHLILTKLNKDGDCLGIWNFQNDFLNSDHLLSLQKEINPITLLNQHFLISALSLVDSQNIILCKICRKQSDHELISIDTDIVENRLIYFGVYKIDGRGLPDSKITVYSVNPKTKILHQYHDIPYSHKITILDHGTVELSGFSKLYHLNQPSMKEVQCQDIFDIEYTNCQSD